MFSAGIISLFATKKCQKIQQIDEVFRKYVSYNNIKSHKKKQVFTPSLENRVLKKPQEEG